MPHRRVRIRPVAVYEKLAEALPVPIWIADESGAWRFVNRAYQAMTGRPAEAELGRGWAELVHPEDREGVLAAYARAVRAHETLALECRLHLADGLDHPVRLEARPQEAPFALSGMIGLGSDLTRVKRLEATIRAQASQLQALEKLKTAFLNAVSHELRTPLSSVLGFAEFLEDELAGPLVGQQHEFVGEILKSGRRLQELIDDLIEIAQLNAGALQLMRQPIDLRQTILDVAAIFRPEAARRNVSLALDVPEEGHAVEVDPDRIGQVLIQLLSNAFKFTNPGGHVVVRLVESAEAYVVSVEDDGIGISSEHQRQLFQRFFQADPSSTRQAGGAGIGLALSKSLIEAHGGLIGCESAPGRGSRFWFSLPKPVEELGSLRVTFAPG